MEVTIINKINILDITFKLFITTPHFSNIYIVIFSNSFINVDLQNCLQLIIFSYKHIFYFLSLNFLSTKENGVITNAKNDEEIRFAYISNSIGNTKSNRDFKTKNEKLDEV